MDTMHADVVKPIRHLGFTANKAPNMSSFEDYSRTCHNYDNLSYALGSDAIVGMLPVYCRKPLGKLHVLDAGCGTGNYTKALLQAGLGQVSMLDASRGMLEKARAKLGEEISSGRVVNITEAKLSELPYPDSSFDAVVFNLVLHHLQPNPDGENFPMMDKAIAEAKRVLKKEGVIVIGTLFTDTLLPLVWFTKFSDPITQKFRKHLPNFEQIRNILDKHNIKMFSKLTFYEPATPEILKIFTDPLGPTRKEWRDTISYWACGTDEEIREVEKKILEMKEEGTLEAFVKENHKQDCIYSPEFIFAGSVY